MTPLEEAKRDHAQKIQRYRNRKCVQCGLPVTHYESHEGYFHAMPCGCTQAKGNAPDMSTEWLAEFGGDIETFLNNCDIVGTTEYKPPKVLDPDEDYSMFDSWQEYEDFMLGVNDFDRF